MIRGTTPTITMELPKEIPVTQIDEAVFSIAQDRQEVVKKKLSASEMTPDGDKNTLCVSLSQADTLALKSGSASMQLKLRIGEDVTASEIVYSTAREILNEDVI